MNFSTCIRTRPKCNAQTVGLPVDFRCAPHRMKAITTRGEALQGTLCTLLASHCFYISFREWAGYPMREHGHGSGEVVGCEIANLWLVTMSTPVRRYRQTITLSLFFSKSNKHDTIHVDNVQERQFHRIKTSNAKTIPGWEIMATGYLKNWSTSSTITVTNWRYHINCPSNE